MCQGISAFWGWNWPNLTHNFKTIDLNHKLSSLVIQMFPTNSQSCTWNRQECIITGMFPYWSKSEVFVCQVPMSAKCPLYVRQLSTKYPGWRRTFGRQVRTSGEHLFHFWTTFDHVSGHFGPKLPASVVRREKCDPRERGKKIGAPRCAVPARRERGGYFCSLFFFFFCTILTSTEHGASVVENLGSPRYWDR